MVEHYIHGVNRRIATVEALAREYAPADDVQSFTSDEYSVLSVGKCQLVVDLRRKEYDLRVDSDTVGKYTCWHEARLKSTSCPTGSCTRRDRARRRSREESALWPVVQPGGD